jgi:hypothetical protein
MNVFGIFIGCSVSLVAGLAAYVVIDSTARVEETHGTVQAVRFSPGFETTTHMSIPTDDHGGSIDVPTHTSIPDSWIVTVEAPLLGQVEVSLDSEKHLVRGQTVYLDYYVGRLSGVPKVTELRLQPRPLVE